MTRVPQRWHGLREDPLALHLLAAPVYALWAWLLWGPDMTFAFGLMLAMWLLVGALLRHWERRGRTGNTRIVAAWALTSSLPGSALLLLPWKRTRRLLVPPPPISRRKRVAVTSRGARAFEIVVGVVVIAAGGIWILIWFLVAVMVWGDFFGENPVEADLEVSLVLALGLLPVGFGVAILLGPRTRGALRRHFARRGAAGDPR